LNKLIFILIASLSSSLVYALDVPKNGIYDNRVKTVDYNPMDVVKLEAHFGYQIDVVLAKGEYVLPKGVYMGDADAWQFGTINNHIFLKPKEDNGRTNLTVITNLRSYSFDLSSHWFKGKASTVNDKDAYYQVNFKYPQDEQTAKNELSTKIQAVQKMMETKKMIADKLNQRNAPVNYNYWVQGSEVITPDEAYDDGRFTTFVFKGNRDIPAIYIVNEDGSESLVNRHVEDDKVIVQTLSRKFVLRLGGSVACVYDESFDATGNENVNGSTLQGVKRTIKGGDINE
jgi:type IV secretion system protein VirB9